MSDLLYIPQVLLSFFLQIAHGILYQQQSMPSQGKILLPVSVAMHHHQVLIVLNLRRLRIYQHLAHR
jgi:hypothetical protein